MRVRLISAAAIALVQPSVSDARTLNPQAKLLQQVVEAVSANHFEAIDANVLARTIVDALNNADARQNELTSCESRMPAPPPDRKRPWLGSLENAVACSNEIRGETQSKIALDAILVRLLADLDGAYLEKITSWSSARKAYWKPMPLRANAGVIGISLKKPGASGSEVVDVAERGPADKAGIRVGDHIVEVNGKPTVNMTLGAVFYEMDQPPESSIELVVQHSTGKVENLSLVTAASAVDFEKRIRESSSSESVVPAATKFSYENGIAVVEIPRFVTAETDEEIRGYFKQLKKAVINPAAVVLDVRKSPSSTLDAAADVADLFLDAGRILKITGRNVGTGLTMASPGTIISKDIPIFVAIGPKTGGAAAILAIALADAGRAKMIGEHSEKGGPIHTLVELSNDRAVDIPGGDLFGPNMEPMAQGIEPQIKVNAIEAANLPETVIRLLRAAGIR